MPVRRNSRGKWVYRTTIKLPDGRKKRIFGTPNIDSKEAAQDAERDHIKRLEKEAREPKRKEVPTFAQWFWGDDPDSKEPAGRFWLEWVVARKNKPSEMKAKKSIYEWHLKDEFGSRRLDEIGIGEIGRFRAKLVEDKKLSEKRINNILAVLSKPLKYACDVELIDRVPKIGLFRIEQPEIEFWDFAEYARILAAAKDEADVVYAAACLAGEAGLRVGEVKGLRWQEDVDLVARTITVNQQLLDGNVGTPKGRTRRTVPMTDTLHAALKALVVVRTGYVIRDLPGLSKTDELQIKKLMNRICRLAGLPERGWHTLRHTFGTHAAMFGVNPWRLMAWLGHKRIDETHRYVHVAEAHEREIPTSVYAAGDGEANPDKRVIKMLGARAKVEAEPSIGAGARHPGGTNEKADGDSVGLSLG